MDKFLNRNETSASHQSGLKTKSTPKSVRKFKEDWQIIYPWIKEQQNGKKCVVCNINIAGSKYHIQRHAESELHKKNENDAKSTPKIDTFVSSTASNDSNTNKAKKLEIMITNFAAEHNLSFAVLDHLNLVIKNGITDSNIVKKFNINRKKGTKIIRECIGPSNMKQIANLCKQQYYSIIVDESTDCTVSKNLAVLIRLFVGTCTDRFLALIQIPNGTSKTIFNAIEQLLDENEIPIKNMVGFGADNCPTMMGNINGVQALFKNLQPCLYVSGCICHNLNLASQHASEALPKTIDDLIRAINNFFCNSSCRKEEFGKFQNYFNTAEHVLIKYASTRWLSRQASVDRIIEQWEPLTYFFTLSNFESKQSHKTSFILSSLKDNNMKLYFLFLSYVLKIINDVNLEMQSEETRIHIVMERLTFLFRCLARNFILKKYTENLEIDNINLYSFHLPTKDIYCGVAVEMLISTKSIPEDVVLTFKENVKNFYIKFLEYLRQKYNFQDFFLNWFSKFSPEHTLNGDTNSVVPLLMRMFPDKVSSFEIINNEYRALSETAELKKLKDLDICMFWNEVSKIKNALNEPLFKHIYDVVAGVLSIPHSSASVERIFSIQNLIKTKIRNRLQVSTLSSLLGAKDLLKSNSRFCFDGDVLKLIEQSNVINSVIEQEAILD